MENNINVIAINSSKRKKNTYGILDELKNNLYKHQISVDIVNLFDYDIKNCLGCEKCLRDNLCPLNDDVEHLMTKLKNYDGIILSSPVYMSNVSGKLKTFLDRTCKWFHRPELVGKPSLVVSTTAGSDLKNVLNYLEKVSIQWGTFPTGKIGKSVKDLNNHIAYNQYNKFIDHLFTDKSEYKPSLNQIIYYQVQKVLALKILEIDTSFWKAKGWDNSIFYYSCSINTFKKIIGSLFYKMLYSKVKKIKN